MKNVDPSIVGNKVTGRFLICGIFDGHVALTYHPDPASNGGFAPWEAVAYPMHQSVDKPWIFPGGESNEFYIIYEDLFSAANVRYACLRSTNGGQDWYGGEITAPIEPTPEQEVVSGTFCAQASRMGAGVCLAYRQDPTTVKLLTGVDVPGAGVSFTRVSDGTQPLIIPLHATPNSMPVPGGIQSQPLVPWVLSDPFDLNRLVVILHDNAGAADPSDMNIYSFRLLRTGVIWSLVSTTLVNTNNDTVGGSRPDEFVPAAETDRLGWIHAAFYSNRPAIFDGTLCGSGELTDEYDVYYALSMDGGLTFQNYNLRTSCLQERALDAGDLPEGYELREYIGIAVDDSNPLQTIVWIAYPGTSSTDPSADKTVLYVSKVVLEL